MRISDWSSDVCSSDLRIAKLVERTERQAPIDEAAIEPDALGVDSGHIRPGPAIAEQDLDALRRQIGPLRVADDDVRQYLAAQADPLGRSEGHTSELQPILSISYAVSCLKHKI